MRPVSRDGLLQYMGENAAEVQNSLTVADVIGRVRVPLLQIYGALDPQSPPEHAERTAAEAGGPTTTVILEDGVHVGNNVWYRSRPLLADWLRETLS
jgi:pimeloyl-ACP methyl ester carboxylesterase